MVKVQMIRKVTIKTRILLWVQATAAVLLLASVSVTESVLCQLVDTSVATKILQFRKLNEDSSVLENISEAEDSSESKILCKKYLQGF